MPVLIPVPPNRYRLVQLSWQRQLNATRGPSCRTADCAATSRADYNAHQTPAQAIHDHATQTGAIVRTVGPPTHRAADDSAGVASGPCACPHSSYMLLSVLRGAQAPACYDGVPRSLPPCTYRYSVGAVTAHSCPGRPHLLPAAGICSEAARGGLGNLHVGLGQGSRRICPFKLAYFTSKTQFNTHGGAPYRNTHT